jgi:hypothetical protein
MTTAERDRLRDKRQPTSDELDELLARGDVAELRETIRDMAEALGRLADRVAAVETEREAMRAPKPEHDDECPVGAFAATIRPAAGEEGKR